MIMFLVNCQFDFLIFIIIVFMIHKKLINPRFLQFAKFDICKNKLFVIYILSGPCGFSIV
jgi:hypothetical protein